MKTLVIAQDMPYVVSNCYIHQLHKKMQTMSSLTVVSVRDLQKHSIKSFDSIVVLLQQRKLLQSIESVARALGDSEVTVYDQDVWENFVDGSFCKNSYETITNNINVKKVVGTSKFWIDRLKETGVSAEFQRIWILPEYCSVGIETSARSHKNGFSGTLHSYREEAFNSLTKSGIDLFVDTKKRSYVEFLSFLSTLGVYVYSADCKFTVNGVTHDLKQSLWAKDVEAMARGCYVLREFSDDASTFVDVNMTTHRMFSSVDEAKAILDAVFSMHPDDRTQQQITTVEHIKTADCWSATAKALLT